MSVVNRIRAGVATIVLFTSTALASQVYLGGPQGVVFRGDSSGGGFEFFGTCGGPISSMALLGNDLFLGTQPGVIYKLRLDNGQVTATFSIANDAAALAIESGDLLVGGSDRTVLRVNPANGALLASYTTPDPVAALAVVGDFIYASGSTSAIYRASAADGVFSYFTCSCFGAVNGLAATDADLFLVDSFGSMWRIDLETGFPMNAFFLGHVGEALSLDPDGMALVGGADGLLYTHEVESGVEVESIQAPVQIFAIAAVDNRCPQDLTHDGNIDLADVSLLLAHFNQDSFGDLDGDNITGLSDLSILLSQFGEGCE